jgi:hypothetical protein
MKNVLFAISFGIILVCVFLSGNAVFSKSKSTCKRISGIVTSIYEDGTKDAVIQISGQNKVFYINRAIEKNLSISSLTQKLVGKEVDILYADNWSPLGSIGESKSISELSAGEEKVYSEFTDK